QWCRIAIRERRSGPGTDWTCRARAGRARAQRLVPPCGDEARRRRRAVLRQRAARAGARARSTTGAHHRQDGCGRRILRRLPTVLAGQEAARRSADKRMPAGGQGDEPRGSAAAAIAAALVAAACVGPHPAMTEYLERLFSLNGRVAVVTGGSSGIGKAMGRALAAAGARVVLIARRASRLEQAVAEIRSAGGTADRVSADLG